MKATKLIVAGIVSYIIAFYIFGQGILVGLATLNQATLFAFFYKFILFIFVLFSFICVTFNLYGNFNKNDEERLVPENIWLLGLLLPICIIVTIVINIKNVEKQTSERNAAIKNDQNYNDSMKKIVLNTTLLTPTFYSRFDDKKELLIKIPVEFGPEASKTLIKTLLSNQIRSYYWVSFNQISGSDIRESEEIPVVGNCKISNQSIRFQDPKIGYTNTNGLSLTQTDPAYFISIYFWGEGCDVEVLKGLVGKSLYIYSYLNESDKSRQIVKEYKINELK